LVEQARGQLPPFYAPLALTFDTPPLRVVDGGAVIGNDGGTDLRVALGDGQVLSVDPRRALPTRLVNRSIGQLAQSMSAYSTYAERVATIRDEAAGRALVQELRRRITRIDAAATRDPETWWSLVLEQADGGLL
jgi:hypothetical protein